MEWPSTKVATALYDFEATDYNEVSLFSGQQYLVIKEDPSGWWEVENEQKVRGLAPSNYLEVFAQK
jgi:hypothetical protein